MCEKKKDGRGRYLGIRIFTDFFVVDFGYNFILGIEISDSFRSLNKFNRISHIQTKTDVFELHFPMRFFLFKDVDFGGLIILAFPIISQ